MAAFFPKRVYPLLVIYALISASKDHQTILAESGQDVTLTCQASNSNIIVVEWSRADLGDEYVLLYRDEQFDPEYQHPSFKNRVDLQDRQMKDGDVSLILKNVTINDTGTYKCRVVQKGTNRRKRVISDVDPISIISLRVVPPDQPGGKEPGGKEPGGKEPGGKEPGDGRGRFGLIAGLSCFGVICVVVAAFVIILKLKKSNSSLS